MAHAKLGTIYWVENKDHKTGEADRYGFMRVQDANGGNERWICFTNFGLADMEQRALKNKEDMPRISPFLDMLD